MPPPQWLESVGAFGVPQGSNGLTAAMPTRLGEAVSHPEPGDRYRACLDRVPDAAASVARYGADCVADHVDDSPWSGDAGRVIDRMRLYLRLHAPRHVALRFGH